MHVFAGNAYPRVVSCRMCVGPDPNRANHTTTQKDMRARLRMKPMKNTARIRKYAAGHAICIFDTEMICTLIVGRMRCRL